FGLEELGLQRIEIVVAVDNWASQRVAEKVGATREGILRKRLLIHGRPQDALMYSLVAEDLDALRMPQEG
ncbi:MAG TPA: GNAT family protein, partial [Pyrinomonadaceae bacterium]|nr:GNAT family protein [Pyrinomonadaceae bacterium]